MIGRRNPKRKETILDHLIDSIEGRGTGPDKDNSELTVTTEMKFKALYITVISELYHNTNIY